ncbi:MAG: hypothetical protein GY841_01925 [FCB group bacterium]|nr:hypothetical protein [FCB group bacterium]
MIIKDNSGSRLIEALNAIQSKISRRLFILIVVLVLLPAVFIAGMLTHRSGVLGEVINPIVTNKMWIINYMKGKMSAPEVLTLDINYENYQKLAYNRHLALKRGRLLPEYRDEVSGFIRYKDDRYRVKLRLKGDLRDHWEDENRWSFRVKVRGENTLFGMKQFSLQKPSTRGFLNEWILHEVLKHEGFVALRYDFVEVEVNGENLGVYAIEEHFEKRLIEHNQRREGPIIKFDDYLRWASDSREGSVGYNDAFYSAPIDAFQTNKIKTDSVFAHQFNIAKNLLAGFRSGELSVNEAFDIHKLARLFALIDLFGHHHATYYANIRFYYNPVTSLLEPIGYDNQLLRDVSLELLEGEDLKRSNWNENHWISLFLKDQKFYEEYIGELVRVSSDDFLNLIFAKIEARIEEKLNILYKSFPAYKFEGKGILYANQDYIRNRLNPKKGLQAYYKSEKTGTITLEIANNHTLPIKLAELILDDSQTYRPHTEYIIPQKGVLKPLEFIICQFDRSDSAAITESRSENLRLSFKVLGADRELTILVHPWSHYSDSFVDDDFIRQPPNVDSFDWMTKDTASKSIFIKPGVWELSQSLIIPPGYVIHCSPGTQLSLFNSSRILSYSPLRFVGSEKNPILIQSPDSTGQGIVVLNVSEESLMEYVLFSNLGTPSASGWQLTGAVTFYESPVKFDNCRFVQNRSEDALNIIRTNFEIVNSNFIDIFSDAFDGDFCEGKISKCSFVGCGNDAVDVSGSLLGLDNIYINGAGDKGISIGENSNTSAEEIVIENAELAVACKDLSKLTISNLHLISCTVGLTLFQKKSEYGPCSTTVTGLDLKNVEVPYLVETGSQLVVDGDGITQDQENIKDLLYGAKYGKSSK